MFKGISGLAVLRQIKEIAKMKHAKVAIYMHRVIEKDDFTSPNVAFDMHAATLMR